MKLRSRLTGVAALVALGIALFVVSTAIRGILRIHDSAAWRERGRVSAVAIARASDEFAHRIERDEFKRCVGFVAPDPLTVYEFSQCRAAAERYRRIVSVAARRRSPGVASRG